MYPKQVPGVVEPLRDGRLCLTSIIEAAKVVTPENCETVLPRFFGLSRREAMEVVAELQPHPAPPSRTVVTSSRTAPPPSARDAFAEAILEAGLDLLLARAEKRKGLVEKPQKTRRPAKPDHIPAHVRRAVWARDGGRCQFPLASGGVCGSTRQLELDHIQPLALGGASTVDNVRVSCRPHNLRAARLALGDELMNRYTADPRGPRPMTRSATASSA
jgi:hypothetical protein